MSKTTMSWWVVLAALLGGLLLGCTEPDEGATIYANEAYAITRAGELVPNAGFQRMTLERGQIIVFDLNRWLVTQMNGQATATNVDAAGCDPACPAGTACVNGRCEPVEACGGGCPAGTICNQGVCVPVGRCDPPCGIDEMCQQNTCVPIGSEGETRCDPECEDDETCSCMGTACECVPNPAEDLGEVTVLM